MKARVMNNYLRCESDDAVPRTRSRALPRCPWSMALVALIVAGCTLPGCQMSGSPLVDRHMKNDQRAQAKGRWENVRGSVKLQLAQEHFKAGRINDAEKALAEAMVLSPDDPQCHLLLTQIRLDRGKLGEAREAITLATMLKPDDAQIQYLAGMVAQRYGDLTTAFEHYANAANLSPHEPAYLLAQAEVLVAMEKPVDALELIEPRLVDFDKSVALRLLAGRISRLLGLRDPAVAYWREAMRLSDDDFALTAEFGSILVWAGRQDEAVTLLSPIVEKAPRIQIESGQTKKRCGAKSRERTVTPSTVHALARAYLATGRAAEALKVLRRVIQDCPEDTPTWRLVAQVAVTQGDLERAAEALQILRDRAAMNAETWMLTGYIALRRGDLPAARDAADKAVALEEGLAEAHFLLGEASEGMGDFAAARAAYVAALRHDPNLTIAERRLSVLTMGAGLMIGESTDGCEGRMDGMEP